MDVVGESVISSKKNPRVNTFRNGVLGASFTFKILSIVFVSFSLFTGVIGCTDTAPKFQDLGSSRYTKPVPDSEVYIITDLTSSSPAISGSCDDNTVSIGIKPEGQAAYDEVATSALDPSSDLNCGDGKFSLVIAQAGTYMGFTLSLSEQKKLNIKTTGANGDFAEADVTIRYLPNIPKISIVDVSPGYAEGQTAVLRLTISPRAEFGAIFNYQTHAETASSGLDYASSAGSVSLGASDDFLDVPILLYADSLYENQEIFRVSLDSVIGAEFGIQQVSVTIPANGTPPGIFVSDASVSEGGTLEFTVSLDTLSGVDATFSLSSASGTATSGIDFVAINLGGTIPAGSYAEKYNLITNQDSSYELDETLLVSLSGVVDASIGNLGVDDVGTGIIQNDDSQVNIYLFSPTAVNEGGNHTFTVSLSGTSVFNVTYSYNTMTSTAIAGDFTATSATGTITAGQQIQTITIASIADTTYEADEVFLLSLSSVVGALVGSVGADDVASAIISNDDSAPFVFLDDLTFSEGTTGQHTVSLSQASGLPVSLSAVLYDQQTSASDRSLVNSGTVVLIAGSVSTVLSVAALADGLDEDSESYLISLSSYIGAQASDLVGVGTINDIDAPPNLYISDSSLFEGDSGNVAVTLSTVSGKTVSFTYQSFDTGSATGGGADYNNIPSTTVSISAGSLTYLIPVTTVEDFSNESNETFDISLSGASNASIVDAQGVVTIIDDDGVPTIILYGATATEGSSVPIIASLTATSGSDVSFTWQTVSINGQAKESLDYTVIAATIATIPAASLTTQLAVPALTDGLDENSEQFLVSISGAVNGNLAGVVTTGTINDSGSDLPPTIYVVDATAVNEGQTLTFEVSLSEVSGRETSFQWSTLDGTASIVSSDYTQVSNQLVTIPEGQRTISLSVPTLTDSPLSEANETMSVTLSSLVNLSVGNTGATGTINDIDANPQVFIGDVTVTEGNSAILNITLSTASAQNISFNWALMDGTAKVADGDYPSGGTGVLNIPASQTSVNLTIPVFEEGVYETTEIFYVSLSGYTNASVGDDLALVVVSNASAIPNILVYNSPLVTEGVTSTFVISLSAMSGVNTVYTYQTVDDTALAPSDYTSIGSTTGTIAAGQTFASVTVTTIDDLRDDSAETETYRLTLSSATNANILGAFGYGYIADNDAAPDLFIADAAGSEGSTIYLTVTLSAPSEKTVDFDYLTYDGTALAGSDYYGFSVSGAQFSPLVQTISFGVTLIADGAYESATEQFQVSLTPQTNAGSGGDQLANVNITNIDSLPQLFVLDSANIVEGSSAVFLVTMNGVSATDVTFTWQTLDGMATNEDSLQTDYYKVTGQLATISALGSSVTVQVATRDDSVGEPQENFLVSISSPSANATIAQASAQITLNDNDGGVYIEIYDDTKVEGNDLVFAVSKSSIMLTDITFDVRTYDVTALSLAPENDYQSVHQTFTIPGGLISGRLYSNITIPTGNDTKYESNETFLVSISNVNNASIALAGSTDLATGTITDNDSQPSISISSMSLNEGESAPLIISLSAVSGFNSVFQWQTFDGSAFQGSGDYVGVSLTQTTIPAGSVTASGLYFVAGTDGLDEFSEYATVSLTPVSGVSVTNSGVDDLATITIQDIDVAPSLYVADVTLTEPGTAGFVISLSAVSAKQVTFNYSSAVGSATGGGADFNDFSGSATFSAGSLAITLAGPNAQDDSVYEGQEVYSINATSIANAAAGNTSGNVFIVDDESIPNLVVYGVTQMENAGNMNFVVSLTGQTQSDVTFDFTTFSGTATISSDFSSTSGTFTVPGTALQTIVSVGIVDDITYENPEQFQVSIFNISSNAVISGSTATGTINNDDSLPSLFINPALITEGLTGSFVVTMSPLSGVEAVFDWQTYTVSGGAETPADFVAGSGQITFASGEYGITLKVATVEDVLDESNEQFRVSLTPVTNVQLNGSGYATGTILDDDGAPDLFISDVAVAEGGTTYLTVSLSAVSGSNVTFNYTSYDSSAVVSGFDYNGTSGSGNIPNGSLTTGIQVSALSDNTYEGDEIYNISLSNASAGNFGRAMGNVTIIDGEGIPGLYVVDASVTEGGTLSFLVTFEHLRQWQTTFNITTYSGTASDSDSDYIALSSQVITANPGAYSHTILMGTGDDTKFELDETFIISLAALTSVGVNNIGIDNVATATIINNDSLPTLNAWDLSLNEGQTQGLVVSLSAISGVDTVFDWSTVNALNPTLSASSGSDYTSASGTATILANNSHVLVNVDALSDSIDEYDEIYNVSISSVTFALFGDPLADVTILDQTAAPSIIIDDILVTEGQPAEFHVSLSVASEKTVLFDYKSMDVSAGGADYSQITLSTGSLAPGAQSFTIAVSTTDDTIFENTETYFISLSSAVDASISDDIGIGSINDNDSLTISIVEQSVATADSVTEGGDLHVTVTLSNPSAITVTFSYNLIDVSATVADNDYTVPSGLTGVEIPPGQLTNTLTVPTVSDTKYEGNEVFRVSLSNVQTASIGLISDINKQLVIQNDDLQPTITITDTTGNEGQTLEFLVSLSAVSGLYAVFNFTTYDGTAVQPTDYTSTTGQVTIFSMATSVTLSIPAILDSTYEGVAENFTVSLTPVSGITSGGSDFEALGTINDVDQLQLLYVSDASVTEGQSMAFIVSLAQAATSEVTFDWVTADGSATVSAGDYVLGSGTNETIAVGELQITLNVATNSDNYLLEGDENFYLAAGNPSAGVSIANAQGIGTIVDVGLCDSGDLDTTCNLNRTVTFTEAIPISGTGNFYINNGGNLYAQPPGAVSMTMGGNVVINSGGGLYGSFALTANNFVLNSGGVVQATGSGYQAAGGNYSSGNGAGAGIGSSLYAGSGAGHGGVGGTNSTGNLTGGSTYGDLYFPISRGSSGGNGLLPTGIAGHGGGVFLVSVTGSAQLDADILVNGSNAGGGTYAGGGGSGGSVYIYGTNISGSGDINAKGGLGGDGTTADGGSGGGGRIAVLYDDSGGTFTWSGSYDVFGGISAGSGGAGEAGTFYTNAWPEIFVNDATANEGQTLEFVVSLSRVHSHDVLFSWSTEAGTAVPAHIGETTGDYDTVATQAMTIPTGDLQVTIALPVHDDNWVEVGANETVTIHMEYLSQATSTIPLNATGSIVNMDTPFSNVQFAGILQNDKVLVTSQDMITFYKRDVSDITTQTLNSTHFCNDQWVILSNKPGEYFVSVNYTNNWNQRNLTTVPSGQKIVGALCYRDQWIFVSSGTMGSNVWRNSNANNDGAWTRGDEGVDFPSGVTLSGGIESYRGKILLGTLDSDQILISSDDIGTSYTILATISGVNGDVTHIRAENDAVLAYGSYDNRAYSTDEGSSWTTLTGALSASRDIELINGRALFSGLNATPLSYTDDFSSYTSNGVAIEDLIPAGYNKLYGFSKNSGETVFYRLMNNGSSAFNPVVTLSSNSGGSLKGTWGGSSNETDTFYLTDVTNVGLSSVQTSNIVTLSGFTGTLRAEYNVGEVRVNSGSWESSSGSLPFLNSGDTIQLRMTSASAANTWKTMSVRIGTRKEEWSVQTGAGIPDVYISDSVDTIEGSNALFVVSLTQTTAADVTFQWQAYDGLADATEDISGVNSGSATIPTGDLSYTITILVADDHEYELNENFLVSLSNLSGNSNGVDLLAEVTIPANDPITLAFKVSTDSYREGEQNQNSRSVLDSGDGHSCYIGRDKQAYCWGYNVNYQLGRGAVTVAGQEPQKVFANASGDEIHFKEISAGTYYTCAIGYDQKGYCWGSGTYGQLGNSLFSHRGFATAMVNGQGPGTYLQIATGYQHTCGVGTDRKLYCWGRNTTSESLLGINSIVQDSYATPRAVSLSQTVQRVSVGFKHSCAVGEDHNIYCWGQNSYGQLGTGDNTFRNIPTQIDISGLSPGTKFVDVSTGSNHTCALEETGKVYCWGIDTSGQLGDDASFANKNTPTLVSGGSLYSHVSAGDASTCAVRTNYVAECWGSGVSGLLGNGASSNSGVPVSVSGGDTYSWVTVGTDHACGRTSGSKIKCWGNGSVYQLGVGTTTSMLVPVPTNEGDNEGGILALSLNYPEVLVTSSASYPSGITIPFGITNLSASGSDYTLSGSYFTIPSNKTSWATYYTITDDAIIESDETFQVGLGVPSVGELGAVTVQTVTIFDNDFPSLYITDASVNEGGTLGFIVSLSQTSIQKVSFMWETYDYTATTADSDYIAQSPAGSETIAAGALQVTLLVATNDDTTLENNETMIVSISGVVDADATDKEAIGTILNNDLPDINIYTVSVVEGQPAVVAVSLSEVAPFDVSFDYYTADATAVSLSDYSYSEGRLTIGSSYSSTSITVLTTDDLVAEGMEYFNVNLASLSGAQAGVIVANVNIYNDDATLRVYDVASVNEGSVAGFVVSLDYPVNGSVSFNFQTYDVSASSGSDYATRSGTAFISAQSSFTVIGVTVLVDGDTADNGETFQLSLSNASTGSIADDLAVATIVDTTSTGPTPDPTITLTEPLSGTEVKVGSSVSTDSLGINYEFARYAGTDGTTITSLWIADTTWVFDELQPNTSYSFMVRARNQKLAPDMTNYSVAQSTITSPEAPRPAFVQYNGATLAVTLATSANGEKNPQTTNTATGAYETKYSVQVNVDGAGWTQYFNASGSLVGTETFQGYSSWALGASGSVSGTNVLLRVRAQGIDGQISDWSPVVQAEASPGSTPPENPVNFQAEATGASGEIQLTWQDIVSSDISTYRILRKAGATGSSSISDGTVVSLSAGKDLVEPWTKPNVIVDEGLTNSTDYTYTLFVKDTSGNWSAGVSDTAQAVDLIPPDVLDFRVYTSPTGRRLIEMEWVLPKLSDFSHVRILKKQGGSIAGYNDGTATVLVDNLETLKYQDWLPDSTNTYHYKIFVSDDSGNWSAGVERTGVAKEQNNNPPSLMAVNNIVWGTTFGALTIDVGNDENNVVNRDKDVDNDVITYSCYVDTVVDGAVVQIAGNACSSNTTLTTAGFAFNTATGVISGFDPTAAGQFEFLIAAQDSFALADSTPVIFRIDVVDDGWNQVNYFQASDVLSSDSFGKNVFVSGNRMLVASPSHDYNSFINIGAVYFFEMDQWGSWTEKQKLFPIRQANVLSFGEDGMCLTGDLAFVSSKSDNSNFTGIINGNIVPSGTASETGVGVVYVFHRELNGDWIHEAAIKSEYVTTSDNFGKNLDCDNDTLVVGVPSEDSSQTFITNGSGSSSDDSSPAQGAAFVFKRNNGTWSQEAYLKAVNGETGDNYGESVAISGDTFAVGASLEDSNQTTITNGTIASSSNSSSDSGAVYVYTRQNNTWTQQAYIKASNANAFDEFGGSVALDGETLAVAAFEESSSTSGIINGSTSSSDNSSTGSGAVYVYKRNSGLWSQEAYIKSPVNVSGSLFGWSMDLDGDRIVMGSFTETNAYIFDRSGSNWTGAISVSGYDTDSTDLFGRTLSLDGDQLIVGSSSNDSLGAGIYYGTTSPSGGSTGNYGTAFRFQKVGGNVNVVVRQAPNQVDPAVGANVKFRVKFSRKINSSTLDASDFSASTSGGSVSANTIQNSDITEIIEGREYEVRVTVTGSGGTVSLSLPASRVQDFQGNDNSVSSGNFDNTVTVP